MKLYKELAWLYAKAYKKIFPYEEVAKFLDKNFKKYRVRKVLEVACGAGHVAKLLKNRGYEVVASDISTELLKIARKLYPDIKFIKQDMRNLKIKEKFDAVICLGRSFSYMLTNEDVEKALQSFVRVLKNHGILIFDCFDAKKTIIEFEKYRKYTQRLELEEENVLIRKNYCSWNLETGITWNWKCEYILKKGKKIILREIDEQILRSFLKSEIEYFLEKNNFKLIKFYPKEFLFVCKKK